MRFRNSVRWVAAVAILAAATIAIKGAQLFTPGQNRPYQVTMARVGVTQYNPASTIFTQTNNYPANLALPSGGYVFPAPGSATLGATISNAGALTGGVPGDDLSLVGTGTYAGTLLTGEVFAFDYQAHLTDPSQSLPLGFFDRFQFRAEPTGGSLVPLGYQGYDIGVTVDVQYDAGDTGFTSFANAFLGHRTKMLVEPLDCNGVIGDYVWRDVNGDGVQQPTPTEQGISGVTVTLTGTDTTGKTYNVTTTTNGSGAYEFPKLCSGDYRVTVDVPGGQAPTVAFAGGNAVVDSNGQALPGDSTKVYADVVLTKVARQDRTIDFGFVTAPVCTGVIGNYVWHDLDRNGLQDANEPGIANVRVNLLDQFGNPFVPARSTVTDASGHYQFEGLCGGSFTVDVDETTLPGGGFTWTPTTQFSATAVADQATDEDDSNGGDAGEGYVLNLPADNTSNLTIDFGYTTQCAGAIGDRVWYDANQNGLQDADEPGIAGVKVTAYLAGDDTAFGTSDDVNAGSSTTDAAGNYLITSLCAGTYKLVVTDVPPQYGAETLSFAPEGSEPSSNPTADANGSGYIVTLASDLPGDVNASDLTIDFGYLAACTGTLGDRVWDDANQNGVQEPGELGLAGAHVIVRRLSDNAVVSDTTTDATGAYQATGLCPGAYRVEVTPPAGYLASPVNQGGDDALDSDPAPFTRTLSLGDMNDDSIDFGFYFPAAPSIAIVKLTNGTDNLNLSVPAGSTVTWTYRVTNTGNVALANVSVVDDNGTPAVPGDDFVVGTLAGLAPGATEIFSTTGTAIVGAYRNVGTATGDYKTTTVTASEPDSYVGTTPPPTPTPGIKIVKTANKLKVVYGESVTYTYVVTNTGNVTLTDIKVVDDNATPSYKADDFTVGTVPSLAAGASATLTATVVPPTKLCNKDSYGSTRHCGMIVVKHGSNSTKFTYLQAKDHRGDYRDNNGWWGGRSYTHRAKFQLIEKSGAASKDADSYDSKDDVDGDSEYESSFSVSVEKSYVAHTDGSVTMPRLYHKKGWDSDWRGDFDRRSGDWYRSKWWDDDKWDHDNDADYDYDKHPKPCPTTSTNVAVVTANYGTTVVKDSDKETVEVVAPAAVAPYKTYTQGGWGAKPSGNNPGAVLKANFSSIATGGAVTIGGVRTLKFTSAYAIEKFLPQGGTPARLASSAVNPTGTYSVLAGQILALKLNVAASAAGVTRTGLGTLIVVSGELAGKTVNEVLALANTVLGGGTLPTGLTLSELNDVVSRINENFDGGTQNNGFLAE